MNRYLIIILLLFFIAQGIAAKADGIAYGMAPAANKKSDITAVHRQSDGKSWLVLRKDNADLLKILVGYFGCDLEDARLSNGDLAVVLDYAGYLTYQIYSKRGGEWRLAHQLPFYPLNLDTRASLILVEMKDLTYVQLTCAKKGAATAVSGVAELGDPKINFEFPRNGSVLRNGIPYDANKDEVKGDP